MGTDCWDRPWKDGKMKPNLFPPIYYRCFPFFHLKGSSNVNDCRNSKYFFSRIGILSCFGNCFGWNWLSFLTQSLFWKHLTLSTVSENLNGFKAICETYCLLLYGESCWLKTGVFWATTSLQLKMSFFTFLVEFQHFTVIGALFLECDKSCSQNQNINERNPHSMKTNTWTL